MGEGTLTERGQISVPAALRKAMKLLTGQRLEFERISNREFRVLVKSDAQPYRPPCSATRGRSGLARGGAPVSGCGSYVKGRRCPDVGRRGWLESAEVRFTAKNAETVNDRKCGQHACGRVAARRRTVPTSATTNHEHGYLASLGSVGLFAAVLISLEVGAAPGAATGCPIRNVPRNGHENDPGGMSETV